MLGSPRWAPQAIEFIVCQKHPPECGSLVKAEQSGKVRMTSFGADFLAAPTTAFNTNSESARTQGVKRAGARNSARRRAAARCVSAVYLRFLLLHDYGLVDSLHFHRLRTTDQQRLTADNGPPTTNHRAPTTGHSHPPPGTGSRPDTNRIFNVLSATTAHKTPRI